MTFDFKKGNFIVAYMIFFLCFTLTLYNIVKFSLYNIVKKCKYLFNKLMQLKKKNSIVTSSFF